MKLDMYDGCCCLNEIPIYYRKNKLVKGGLVDDTARSALRDFFSEIPLEDRSSDVGLYFSKTYNPNGFIDFIIFRVFLFDDKAPSTYCFDDFYLYKYNEQTHGVEQVTEFTPYLKKQLETYRKFMRSNLAKISKQLAKKYNIRLNEIEKLESLANEPEQTKPSNSTTRKKK